MYEFPIGVLLQSFRTDTKTAIKKAAEMGMNGLQLYATLGENTPENLDTQKRKELLDMVKSYGIKFSALCGEVGHGFGDKERNPEFIELSKRVLDLALDLETDVVTTHVGLIPKDSNSARYKVMQEACFELSRYADSMNAHFAIETGPEKATILKGFLDSLGSKGVGVNLDPANLVMVAGDDPVQAVYTLKDYIVHTHAKDGRKLLKHLDPEDMYGSPEKDILRKKAFIELPLGEGDVDFPKYLKALEEVGYRGFLTIEREVGECPEVDIEKALRFLKQQIGEN